MNRVDKYVGKKYKHNGRGDSLDCLGLVISYLNDNGYNLPADDGKLINEDWYQEDPERLIRSLKKYCNRISIDQLQPLDVVVFSFNGVPRHMGVIVSRGKMLHARQDKKAAVIRIKHYKRFFHSAWRIKGGESN